MTEIKWTPRADGYMEYTARSGVNYIYHRIPPPKAAVFCGMYDDETIIEANDIAEAERIIRRQEGYE